ncbi:hypothetical protein FJZ28_00530 [Candidatus Peregrinibacteria bacterium]|nr:hypothetical protein [Candidatus Peregrinibacteria bacterium]
MPLKHFTETFLIVALGAIIALTGLLISTLPHLPDGALPWAVLFALSIIYPLLLLPMFRVRRADTFFRNVHWFPSLMLLIWLALEGMIYKGVLGETSVNVFTWGWALGAVAFGFLLIVYYCLQVIRRRVPRVAFLSLILVPFAAFAIVSERGSSWESELSASLWGADFWQMNVSSGALALLPGGGSKPVLEPSDDAKEEQWRERLREQERREERIAARMKSRGMTERKSASSEAKLVAAVASSSSKSSKSVAVLSGTGDELRNAGTMPGKLPTSGFGWSTIISLLAVGYVTLLQRRAQERA